MDNRWKIFDFQENLENSNTNEVWRTYPLMNVQYSSAKSRRQNWVFQNKPVNHFPCQNLPCTELDVCVRVKTPGNTVNWF